MGGASAGERAAEEAEEGHVEEAAEATEGVVFIQLAGQVLALFGREALAADMRAAAVLRE